jgi:hypothetical protein
MNILNRSSQNKFLYGGELVKKVITLVVLAAVMVATLVATPAIAAPKGIDVNGPHFNLNLIGKSKTMPGDYDNPDRHTMFVPLDTSEMYFTNPDDPESPEWNGVKITITQPADTEDFAVIDGNATDGFGEFQMGPGKYYCYIAVKAKAPKSAGEAVITGWVQAYDNTGTLWYYIPVGTVTVSKSDKKFTDATDLLFVTAAEDPFGFYEYTDLDKVDGLGLWVFDYLNGLDTWYEDSEGASIYNFSDLAYFWQLQNNGAKLIQVRFYPM